MLRRPGSRFNLSKINAIGRKSPDILSCVWRCQCAAFPTLAPAPWRVCRENQLIGLPSVARVGRTAAAFVERWIDLTALSVIRRWAIRPRDRP